MDTSAGGLDLSDSVTVKCGSANVLATVTPTGSNKLTISLGNYTLNKGKLLTITIKATVTSSNFTLANLENAIDMSTIKNRNGIDIKDILNGYNLNSNKDYVRLKNVVISGTVWNDKNENGVKNSNENGIQGIEVRLIDITNKKYLSVQTDSAGKYSFNGANAKGYKINNYSESNGAITYTATTTQDSAVMIDSSGRVVKATHRNASTGNYANNSSYINYILEFKYDGISYYTTAYQGRNHIKANDLSIENAYKTDSNAKESTNALNSFNNSLDIIYYNKAKGKDGSITNVTYTKNGHVSQYNKNNYYLKAYSFSDGSSITPLWLKKTDNTVLGESEYLKYINLGLISKVADLSVSSDVTSITTYIGGEDTTYAFGQGRITNSGYDGAYRTGGENQDKFYELKIYSSDYYYQSSDYNNADIANYKKNTELEIQVKYKICIYNESDNGGKTYARIQELTDYYGKLFKTDLGGKTTVKLYDAQGNLVSQQINNFEVSRNYTYSKNITYTDKSGSRTSLNKLYFKTPIDIAEGGKAEFELTFTVKKESKTLSTGDVVKLLSLNDDVVKNIVEINAYSIYKDGTTDPFGLIDKDSNPGNISNGESVSQYEDDTYESKLKITQRTRPDDSPGGGDDSERTITGYVWEDARSETLTDGTGIQYVGNGIYNTSDVKKNLAISLASDNYNDKRISGVTAHLVEEVRIPQSDGSYKLYEYDLGNSESKAYKEFSSVKNQVYKVTTGSNGKYELKAMAPGIYKVRFYYGSETVSGQIGNPQLTHNGQDFKSTKYTGVIQDTTSINKLYSDTPGVNTDLKAMASANKNDALDDEVRRLESMTYSEIQTNQNQSVINQNNIRNLQDNGASTTEINNAKKEYVDKTYMYADTGFMRLNTELTRNSNNDIEMNKESYSFTEVTKILDKVHYSYKVNNIDFGVEYRPKTAVSLNKYISEYTVRLSDNSILSHGVFNNVYDKNTHALIGTIIDREHSTGLDTLMIMNPLQDKERGIMVLQVDNSILRGATININYVLVVKNEGEVDRISNNLDGLRNSYNEIINSDEKNKMVNDTISAIALERLQDEYKEQKNGDTTIINLGNTLNRLKYKSIYNESNNSGYYGKYLGSTYYKAVIGNKDVIAKTKINNIVDYVPTTLELDQNQNIGENQYWSKISIDELLDKYIDKNVVEQKSGSNKNIYDIFELGYYDYSSQKSNIVISVDEHRYTEEDNTQNKSLSRLLIPIKADDYSINNQDGTTKSSGIININASITLDKIGDLDNHWYTNSSEIVEILSQTGRCIPTQRDRVGVNGNRPKSSAINIPDNITQDDTFQREYVRNLSATLGNFKPRNMMKVLEIDSAASDPFVLIPPTGLVPLYLKLNSGIVISVAIGIIIVLMVIIIGKKKKVAIRKFLKRKKINISFKKYYK